MAGSEEPMTPADTALALLRESRDGGRIFTDNGATVTRREGAIRAWWKVTRQEVGE